MPAAAAATAAAAAAAALNEIRENIEDGDNSLLCLDSLCKSIQMHTDATAAAAAGNCGSANLPADLSNYSKEEMMQDFAEFLGSYTREQDQKRWINERLNFIEGKPQQPQTANPKKAAKKAKQKQRKEEEKRIKELEDLRSQFLDIYFKEFIDKYEMKTLTAAGGRKREKKRIAELEANIKNLQRAKGKVETVILELIATVKQANSEFKFSYLPTKEQQLAKLAQLEEILSGGSGQATATAETVCVPAPASISAPPTSVLQPVATQYPNFISSAAFFPPHTPVCYAPPQQQQQQQLPRDVIAAMAANAITADPSKRIVTIRRVQLPHASGEQQVTVVAKGSSPDEDKLLYTFVNGHMVASTQTGATKSTQVPAPVPASVAQNVPEKSAKAKKKEAKKAAAAAAAAAATAAAAAAAELEAKAKNNKKQAKKISSSSGNSSKSQTPQSSAVNTRENSVCSVKPKTTKKIKMAKEIVLPKSTPVAEPEPEPEPEPIKRQKRLKSRLDQGQLDNNPFKSLHVQDSSDGEWETGSESELSSEPPVVAPPLKMQPKVQTVVVKPTPISNTKQKPAAGVAASTAVPLNKPKSETRSQTQQQQQLQQQQQHVQQQVNKAASGSQRRASSHQQVQPPAAQPAQSKNQSQRTAAESNTNSSTRKSKSGQDRQAGPVQSTQTNSGNRASQQQTRGGRGSGRSKNTSGSHQVNSVSTCSSSNVAETSGQPSKRSQRGKRGHRGQKQGK